MVAARRAFLDKGWYAPLREALAALAVAYTGSEPVVLDAGCGEGYYTVGVREALASAGKAPHVAGFDISKFAVQKAAKRCPELDLAVASAYHLPVADGAVDLLLNVFSPLAIEEFRRVLKPGGYYLYVVPAAHHLWELKEVLYDAPYLNEEKETPYEGFSYEKIVPVSYTVHLPNQEDIQALFQMTPYAWKTPGSGKARLAALTELDCQVDFRIHVFKKRPEPYRLRPLCCLPLVLLQAPAVEGIALDGAEDLLAEVGIALLQLPQEHLHLLPAGGAVGRAGIFHHRQIQPPHRSPYLPLLYIEHGPDLGDAGAVQVRHRLEAAYPSLQEEGHDHGLHRVILMVSQGDLGDPQAVHGGAQGAPPELGAQGAGIFLLAVLKNDLVDGHLFPVIGHLQLPAEVGNGGKVHAWGAAVNGDGYHIKGLGVKLPEPGQSAQCQYGILAAADAYRHRVPPVNHMIILHTPADQR